MVMVMWSRARACNTTYSPIIPLVYPGLLAAVSDEIILLIETLEKDRCEVSPGTPTRETRMHRNTWAETWKFPTTTLPSERVNRSRWSSKRCIEAKASERSDTGTGVAGDPSTAPGLWASIVPAPGRGSGKSWRSSSQCQSLAHRVRTSLRTIKLRTILRLDLI